MPSDDPTDYGRRDVDRSPTTFDLILLQLTELKVDVREGFARLDARHEGVEKRVSSLEAFRERQEGVALAEARASANVNGRWVPALLAVGTLGGSLAVAILGHYL